MTFKSGLTNYCYGEKLIEILKNIVIVVQTANGQHQVVSHVSRFISYNIL